MIIEKNIKKHLQIELSQAKIIWIATAMISNSGWSFLQSNLPKEVTQHYLIGIDFSTDPNVFQSILGNLEINARVYENAYTFHPKVYIIQKSDNSLIAFIGSSNTTSWGLEKNVEMNYQITDQEECRNLIGWFNQLFLDGYLINKEFLDDYKIKFTKASSKVKEIKVDTGLLKKDLSQDKGQFFSRNQHEIFKKQYHRVNTLQLLNLRKDVKNRFIELHECIYTYFSKYGITDLHCHHQKRERVSRHYFNQFSGNYINAIWLHYGKSKSHLHSYSHDDDKSFINHARIQVIIHEDSIGIWLVLGKDLGSQIDRDFFKAEMQKTTVQQAYFNTLKQLDDSYWFECSGYSNRVWVKNIKSPQHLHQIIQKENIENYFIIGCDVDWLDSRISSKNISSTILQEFGKLYQLYVMMRHK